jgi:hypothetical protein
LIPRPEAEYPLLWSSKISYKLAQELKQKGDGVTQRTVCDLLEALGYSLQANKKVKEGSQSPVRNKPFQYISKKIKRFQQKEQPVISVDTKKKKRLATLKILDKNIILKRVHQR